MVGITSSTIAHSYPESNMEIIKRLSLNRTPKDLLNNSIVCAKNMMIDDTGSFLTQDTSIQEVWTCPEGGEIVGIIPCNDELVIFTAVHDLGDDSWDASRVWRKRDNSNTTLEVICNWEYSGGVINGGCTYNYKNELIIVVAESGASKDVPLKSFIVHENNNGYYGQPNQTYATEENIPAVNVSVDVTEDGDLVCGVYTFFIRYKIDKDNYTKWFQITHDVIITQDEKHKPYNHNYVYDTAKGIFGDVADNHNSPTTIVTATNGPSFTVNKNGISNKEVVLHITKNNIVSIGITDCQIGYIVRRNDDTQGRIFGEYTLGNSLDVHITNNVTLEDENIDSFLENPHQFFNVEIASIYNNRLYISNYDEYSNELIDDNNTIDDLNFGLADGTVVGNKMKTVIPKQAYNIYIHYIRPDGSATNGFNLGIMYWSDSTFTYLPKQIGVQIQDNKIRDGYIGYFLTYEEIDRVSESLYITYIREHNTVTKLTNAEILYDLDSIIGDKIYTDSNEYDDAVFNKITNGLIENHLLKDGAVLGGPKVVYVVKDRNAIYNKTTKTLYRLTPNIYKSELNVIYSGGYTPDYYTIETILYYSSRLIQGSSYRFEHERFVMDGNGEYVYSIQNDADIVSTPNLPLEQTEYDIHIVQPLMFSKYPLYAMSIKQDYLKQAITLTEQKYVSGEDNPTKRSNLYLNEFVSPDRLHDLLELKPAYRATPLKIYTNYREDNISRFDKTIYRSDVVSDESLVNGFRHFEPNNYKNILENKGKITNIIGIGLYLLVHTEYSLFMFDRSPKLTAKLQSDIPDTFDIDYQEVMPSNQGFGGLQDKKESIVTKNGYVWFDKVNKYIFNFVDGKTEIISKDIHNFIKVLSISKVRFAEDIIHNRLIICFTLTSGKYITLSYNFNTKTFISAHDYQFTDNYRTYKKSYLVYRDSNNSKNINNKLYEYTNNHTAIYSGLYDTNNAYIPTYIKDANSSKSFIDIIYNIAPENSKTLISLSYVLNEILLEIYDDNQAEGKHKDPSMVNERGEPSYRYSGDELILYTDETNTGLLDIHVKNNEFNKYAEYRYPIFNKGIWELNYFRNIITTPTEYEEEVQAALELTKPPVLESDPRSLIYGKYIVARFIFNNDTKVKLDNITFNTEAY